MHPQLKKILEEKKKEVTELKKKGLDSRIDPPFPIRDFRAAISLPDKIGLIAEIKFASPSAGEIRVKTDPVSIARTYEAAGASAISLLTDRKFFHGDLRTLPLVKGSVKIPILRKDFIIDEIQVREAFIHGADAVLLIARILSFGQLRGFIELCHETGLTPLTEVHDRQDLQKALECKAGVIGINNRDLDSFKVDVHRTYELAGMAPAGCTLISESGIQNKKDIENLKATGVRAVLVGSALMGSSHIARKTEEFVRAGHGV